VSARLRVTVDTTRSSRSSATAHEERQARQALKRQFENRSGKSAADEFAPDEAIRIKGLMSKMALPGSRATPSSR
jgi:hypothetical protein